MIIFRGVTTRVLLGKWQKGETGYPIVDAGMKELRTTGYSTHNRVRMIVGSLVENLLLIGGVEKNGFGIIFLTQIWQTTVLDGNGLVGLVQMLHHISEYLIQLLRKKFDPEGEYTRHFLPVLSKLPSKFLFNPWDAPTDMREQASVLRKLSLSYCRC